MNFTLAHTGLLNRFSDRMFSADDVDNPKPAPDLFLLAARAHQVASSHCDVAEDSPAGIRAARAAGMRVFGFAAMTPAPRLIEAGAHVIFSKMSDLPRLLEQHEGDARARAQLKPWTPQALIRCRAKCLPPLIIQTALIASMSLSE